jgi:hypothetical protein
MTTGDAATARKTFVTAQVAALAPLEFVVVGVSRPPFDAVQVLREEDASFAVIVSPRNPATGAAAYGPEQVTALARLGFPASGVGGTAGLEAAVPPADAGAAAALVESVLAEVFGVDEATPVDVRHGSEKEVREAAAQVQAMRARIEPVLVAFTPEGKPAPQDDDGDYVLDIGHVRVFVAPRSMPGPPPPIIRVFAITNAGVNLTSELGLFLSRLNFTLMFGRFSIDSDNGAVWFDETLLGEHVTDEELRFTVEMVAGTANEWDQKIAAMFGGRIRSPEEPPAGTTPAGDGPPANKPGQGGYL